MTLSKFQNAASLAAASLPAATQSAFNAETLVLVTGGTGLVGQAFVYTLDALTARVGGGIHLVVRDKERAQRKFTDLQTENVRF